MRIQLHALYVCRLARQHGANDISALDDIHESLQILAEAVVGFIDVLARNYGQFAFEEGLARWPNLQYWEWDALEISFQCHSGCVL